MANKMAHQPTILVLQRGDELVARLNEYAVSHGLDGAWLQSGIGGADHAVLSFYNLETRSYEDRAFDEPLEILSLQGNLAWVDDEPFWHIHGVLGGRDFAAVGGHVKELRIALTGELLLTPLDTIHTRTYDDKTGLKLLDDSAERL